ncbi:MAG: SIR2 family protein [Thaumarchaeota archaeon]|nr:SIR2 family protein [Nitrososphaerota archaeon]
MNVALFLGAGASVPFGKPTTKVLKEKLSEIHTLEPQFISWFLHNESYPDIEYVFQAINEIQDFSKSHGVKIFHGNLYMHHDSFNTSFSDFVEKINNVRQFLEKEIFHYYSWDDKYDDILVPMYVHTLSILEKISDKIIIFTTNYDRAIEEFCSRGRAYRCVDGFKQDLSSQRFIWNNGDFSYFDGSMDKKNIYLYKLHGSLNWKIHKKFGIERTSSEDISGDPNYQNNLLIYPSLSLKDGITEEPYNSIRKNFENMMKNDLDACIVIGFSFRDNYLNQIFKDFVNNKKKLIVISPHAYDDVSTNLGYNLGENFDKKRTGVIPSNNNVFCIPDIVTTQNIASYMAQVQQLLR